MKNIALPNQATSSKLQSVITDMIAILACNQKPSLDLVSVKYLEDWCKYDCILKNGSRYCIIELPIVQIVEAENIGVLEGLLRHHVEIASLFLS